MELHMLWTVYRDVLT